MSSSLLAKTPIDEKIVETVAPMARAMGFELVRVRLMGGKRPTLQIMAEKPDGTMDVEDCAEFSRQLSVVLDVYDPIDREYVLEISSPGIDRPLTRLKDFERFAGFEAKLETHDLIDGRKRFRGQLLGVDGDTVRLKTGDIGEIALAFEDLSDAKLLLTDELIAASLKGRGRPGAPAADGAEIDVGANAQDGDEVTLEDGTNGADTGAEGRAGDAEEDDRTAPRDDPSGDAEPRT